MHRTHPTYVSAEFSGSRALEYATVWLDKQLWNDYSMLDSDKPRAVVRFRNCPHSNSNQNSLCCAAAQYSFSRHPSFAGNSMHSRCLDN